MAEYLTDAELAQAKDMLNRITMIYQAKVVGQEDLRTALTACLLAGGHVLVESVPGLAKTTAAQTLASAVSGTFHRIQCTPDLMPNDIVGSQIWNQASGEMVTQLGPVHANLVLMDEINRSSAKTQSAMLEAMQEGQTTIGGVNHRLPRPFMVMATQNPIEEEGTYVLPEAQMDRFLLKEIITYPAPVEELEVLERIDSGVMSLPTSSEPVSITDVLLLQDLTRRIYVHSTLKAYIVDIINTTRGAGPNPLPGWTKHVRVGASPRGAIALMQISQALALMDGRNYVVPDDIKKLRYGILRHRIIRTFDALADNVSVEGLVDAVFNAVPVP
ncbi:MAG: MoxR family ATPase [Schaalia odontolytica]|nr:MoxR family ATPase [Schaalia odontolytica]MDU5761512.1 MoxR family ATPase [Schaalia odontolytica]